MTSPFVILRGHIDPPLSPISSQPAPWFQIFPGQPTLVYLPHGSQVFAVDVETASALAAGDPETTNAFRALAQVAEDDIAPEKALPGWNALSLNVAQSCNLTCDYCYADEGRFGGRGRLMDPSVAVAAVERFLTSAPAGRVTIGFIGGEPFLNRKAMVAAVQRAIDLGASRHADTRFSVTTNGTLLMEEDIAFLRRHRFAVSVSVDGSARINDTHRRTRLGGGSSGAIAAALRPLLEDPQGCRIAARATITRDDLDVLDRLNHLEEMGFTESGVSPLRSSPLPHLALRDEDWPVLLSEMCRAGEVERRRIIAGLPIRFSNLYTAIVQIHRGHSVPLPCGSAANYLSANAEGEFYTCHRTIDDKRFYLGDLSSGPSDNLRGAFLSARHVDRQEECRTCWARYLCGGGCHAEVIASGRQGCDFIRGWLEYCLRFHNWVLNYAPHLLSERT
jgi:uncharacterized protein